MKIVPCPLCCRAFRSKESACKHVIICHENYNKQTQKQKFLRNLKSAVNVRVTNLSQLLLNQLSTEEIIKRAKEIVTRIPKEEVDNTCRKSPDVEKVEPNYHVSQFCKVCQASKEDATPPILTEILFENSSVELPIKFSSCGDGLELVELAGVTNGYCYKCELQIVDPKI